MIEGISLLVALAATAAAVRVVAARLRAPELPPPDGAPPRVDVLVPMRDEEENVVGCLAALRAQTVPLSILVLDDGSRDRTAALAAELAAKDDRIEIRTVPPPPPGTNGKLNALETGLRSGDAPWVLALDADARVHPEAVGRALAAARKHGLAAVSLAARQEARSAGEALVTPPVYALLDALLGDWGPVAVGGAGAVANGQFFLVRRDALDDVGGYASVRERSLDDVALAERLSEHGHRVGFWRARELLRVRMYRGFGESFRGWRRNLALILGDRPLLAVGAAAVACAPLGTAAAAFALGAPAAALLVWGSGTAASILLRVGGGASPAWGLLYPVDGVVLAAGLVAAVADRRRGRVAAWRGREIPTS